MCCVGATILVNLAVVQLAPAAPPAQKLGTEVRAIFAAKCGQCHSDRLAKPKGHFGYVLDLRRVASDPQLILPYDADHSKMWQRIEDDDMPPDDAKAGPLSDQEKGLIRWWIDAGAPAATETSPASASANSATVAPSALGKRLLQWLGRFHVLVIHFPIALLMAAAIAEVWWMWRGRHGMSPAVRYCVLLGAAGAIAAAALGWARAPFVGSGAAQTLFLHRWAGTAACVLAIAAAVASEYDILRAQRSRLFRAALFASALFIGLAGHLGGTFVYGDRYFSW